jgi:uncharacterized protein
MPGKILVVSDSHGNLRKLDAIVRHEEPFDVLVHCGDGVDDISKITIPGDTRVLKVTGNVDISRGYIFERTIVEELFGRRIMVTHGDLFRVERDLTMLLEEGRQHGADLICFGHTHMKFYHDGPIVLFSPGPANDGFYGVITIGADIRCRHRNI